MKIKNKDILWFTSVRIGRLFSTTLRYMMDIILAKNRPGDHKKMNLWPTSGEGIWLSGMDGGETIKIFQEGTAEIKAVTVDIRDGADLYSDPPSSSVSIPQTIHTDWCSTPAVLFSRGQKPHWLWHKSAYTRILDYTLQFVADLLYNTFFCKNIICTIYRVDFEILNL